MKQRKTQKHLPSRVYLKCGSYYFVDANNKWHMIGKSLSEAMKNWSSMIEPQNNIVTMRQLFDRYMLEVAPQKAERTYKDNKTEIQNLYEALGHYPPDQLTPVNIYEYLETRGKIARTRANRETALLSHVFSMAIRWGVVRDNPCRNVKRLRVIRRDHYITDTDFSALRAFAPSHLQRIMDLALITGLRQADILKIQISDIKEDGLFVLINKTKIKILIEWSDELKSFVYESLRIANEQKSVFLFPNTKGKAYSSSGFQSIWQKLIVAAIEKNIIKERFRFHDIRRKTATDIDHTVGREHARQLLGHTDQKTTDIYISGTRRVKPKS